MPVKWHCPIVFSNTRASFFSENGQTSLVTCLMTNVVKRMTYPTLPRSPHLPWVEPVHPPPASEFRTPGLPVRAVTAPRTTLPGRKLAAAGGSQRRLSTPPPPPRVSSQGSTSQNIWGAEGSTVFSVFPHLLLLPAYAPGIPGGM